MMESSTDSLSEDYVPPNNLINRASTFLTQSFLPAQTQAVFHGHDAHLDQSSDSLGGLGDIFALQEESLEAQDDERPLNNKEIRVQHDEESVLSASTIRRRIQSQIRDAHWLSAYLTCCLLVVAITLWAYFIANAPYTLPASNLPDDAEIEEAASLLAVIPLITSLTLLSIIGSMATLFLLSQAVQKILYGLLICGPAFIISTAFWTWGESWSNSLRGINDGQLGSEARWACLAALLIAGLAARMIYTRLDKIDKTIQVIELALSSLIAHPALFIMQLGLLLSHLIITLPFFSLLLRLLLLHPTNPDSPVIIMTIFSSVVYLWTLSIFRNLSKLTSAICISYWYMQRHEPNPSHGTATDLVKIAFDKARGPQLGTVILGSLILSLTEITSFVFLRLKKWLNRSNGLLPASLSFLYFLSPFVIFLNGIVSAISNYALIYAGLTGAGFWESTRKVTDLIRGNGLSRAPDYLLVKTLLSLLTISFSVLAGLLGILSASASVRGSLSVSHFYHHAFATLLAFFIPHFAVRLCSDLLSNAVDSIFICWNVDVQTNQNHCQKAQEAFAVHSEDEDDMV